MNNLLEVREFDTITCNQDYENSPNFRFLDEGHFRELEHFIKEYTSDRGESDALEFMKIGYRRGVGDIISFKNNVGIIELPSGFQIEILPKIDFDEEDICNKNTKQVFLNMLRCLHEFEGKAFGNAALNVDRMNLYEIFINMYLQETRKLVKRGIKSAYIQKEENIGFYKGKLMVGQHIKNNLLHKERFYMQFDEYMVNRAENKLIKAVLCKLQKTSRNSDNVKEIRQLLVSFEFVDESTNYQKDFAEVSIGREMKEYDFLIKWAKVFLMNKSFTTFSGKQNGKAILFPMERIFESFIARWVKLIFEEQAQGEVTVSSQDKGYYLFDEPRKFRLRPDIVVRGEVDGIVRTVIMDTKWKKLKNDVIVNYGISQSDMYQMYAYSKKYDIPDIWLIYPLHDGVKNVGTLEFCAKENGGKDINVRAYFVDLEHYYESISELFQVIFKKIMV